MNADAIAGFGPRTLNMVLQAELAKLHECRNDLDYGFASGLCGYRHVSRGETIELVREIAMGNPLRAMKELMLAVDDFGCGKRPGDPFQGS